MTQQSEAALKEFDEGVLKVITEIDKVRASLSPIARATPEVLSQAVVQLAALNSFLGEHVATAEFNANNEDARYRHAREKLKIDSMNKAGITASEAESIKVVDSKPLLDITNKAIYIHKLLANKRRDTSELIDALRSRLSFVKIEMGESRNT